MAREMPVLPLVVPGWCGRRQLAVGFGLLDHLEADTVLNAAGGVLASSLAKMRTPSFGLMFCNSTTGVLPMMARIPL